MKIIGITGLMGSGKTTLCKEIIKEMPNIKYIDVDNLRTELIENEFFLREISELSGRNINNRKQLNDLIYNDSMSMSFYKSILYQKLFNKIKSFNKDDIILVEWALIIQDNLFDKFDNLIIINKDIDYILNNVYFSDLSQEEVIKRLEIQKPQFKNIDKITIDYKIHKNLEDSINYIRRI